MKELTGKPLLPETLLCVPVYAYLLHRTQVPDNAAPTETDTIQTNQSAYLCELTALNNA